MAAVLERETELARIAEVLAAARDGRGTLLTIEGPAGAGKTRLLEEAARSAEANGFAVATACGSELEQEFGFGLVRQLLEPPLVAADRDARAALLEGAAGAAAPALGFAPETADPEESRFALLHGLYWLTANLSARRPLLLVVDDLQWGDDPSLRYLAYLARRLTGVAAAVAVAFRPAAPGEPRPLLEAVAATATPPPIEPAPLSAEAVSQLAVERFGEPLGAELVRACHTATAGNALLVEELLAELVQRAHDQPLTPEVVERAGAERLARRVGRRLDALAGGAAALAEAVAVLGDGCELGLAAELAGLSEAQARAAAAALIAADILADRAEPRFRHPLVRAAIGERLPAVEVAAAQGRAADLLAARGASPPVLAVHLLAAPPSGRPWVAETLELAAGEALRQGDPELAARRLRRALEEPAPAEMRPSLLVELGAVETAAGSAGGVNRMREGISLMPDPADRAAGGVRLAGALAERQRWAEGADVARAALTEIGEDQRELRLMLRAILADCVRMDLGVAGDEDRQIVELAATLEGRTPGERWVLATAASLTPVDTAAGHAQAAELLARGWSAEAGAGRPDTGIVSNLIRAGRLDEADRAVERFMAEARRGGWVHRHALMLSMRGWIALERGRLASAQEDLRVSLELSDDVALPVRPTAAMLALTLAERGELEEAEALIAETQLSGELPEQQVMNLVLFFRARAHALTGRAAEALGDALEVGRRYERWGIRRAVPPWRSLSAVLLAGRGEHERALALADEELELAERWGTPLARGIALRGAGLVARDPERIAAAAAELEVSPHRLEWARTLVELGATLRRAGARADARAPLRAGMDGAHACGAHLLAERARTELLATGARPRRLAASGADSLTPSERRVVDLAAAGRTNRQIAQDLFVTTATVETHLRHAFRKLDVSARAELAAALDRSSG